MAQHAAAAGFDSLPPQHREGRAPRFSRCSRAID
jgi:hypothetical protein